MIDRDEVVNAAVAGGSIGQIAKRFAISPHDVRMSLDEYEHEMLRPSGRAAALAIEVNRIDQLEVFFLRQALEDRDTTAGTLCCNLSQRKAALLGLDQPAQLKMDLAVVEQYEESSTESLRRVVNELRRTELMSPEARERAAQYAEARAKFLRGEGSDPAAAEPPAEPE